MNFRNRGDNGSPDLAGYVARAFLLRRLIHTLRNLRALDTRKAVFKGTFL